MTLERLTVGHYMMRRWSLEDDVRHLERLGFRSISLASTKLRAYGAARARAGCCAASACTSPTSAPTDGSA